MWWKRDYKREDGEKKDIRPCVKDFGFYTNSKRQRSIDFRYAFLKALSGSCVNIELWRTKIITEKPVSRQSQ